MNPRERPGKRGMVFPPSYSRDQFSPAEEEAHERLQEAEAQRAPADTILHEDVVALLDEAKRLRSLGQHVARELDEVCLMAQHAQGQHGQVYGPLSERLAKLSVVLRDGLWPEEAA